MVVWDFIFNMFKLPKNDKRYTWTSHVKQKMMFYGITPSMVKRIIRHPHRTEEGIAEDTVASMQKAKTKKPQEIWVMYSISKNPRSETINNKHNKIKIITAWRFPGISPERDPVPQEVINEVKSLL